MGGAVLKGVGVSVWVVGESVCVWGGRVNALLNSAQDDDMKL